MDVSSLSLSQRVGQLIWPRLGSNMPPPVSVDEDAARVEQLLATCPIGGLLVFNGAWPSSRDALERLQDVAELPLLIGSDIERGMGQQFDGLTLFPHAQAFDALGESASDAVAEFARITAREAQMMGVHVAFMPVADVDLYDLNPIIATRSFSREPKRAAEMVGRYVEAAESAGLLTVAKHFPGHGRTTTDSHDEVPLVDASREEIEAADLLPFRRALASGVSCVMTAHVAYPALDSKGTPATRSPAILERLLREDMGFRGLVVSDSLLMEGAKQGGTSLAKQASDLISAGVDVLLDPPEPEAAHTALCAAVEEGMLSESRVSEAADRVLKLKEKAGLFDTDDVSRDEPDLMIHKNIARQIARSAVVGNHAAKNFLPRRDLASVMYLPTHSAGHPEGVPLRNALHEHGYTAEFTTIPPDGADTDEDGSIKSKTPLLIAIAGGPAAWRSSRLSAPQQKVLQQLVSRRDVVVASLGPRALLHALDEDIPALCTWSDVPDACYALIDALTNDRVDIDTKLFHFTKE